MGSATATACVTRIEEFLLLVLAEVVLVLPTKFRFRLNDFLVGYGVRIAGTGLLGECDCAGRDGDDHIDIVYTSVVLNLSDVL